MIGNHLKRLLPLIDNTDHLCRTLNQRLKEIGLIVGVDPLENCRHTFQPHTGIDRGLWQWIESTFSIAIELHKDQVPDLNIAIPFLFRGSGRTAWYISTVVKEDLTTRATGTGLTH